MALISVSNICELKYMLQTSVCACEQGSYVWMYGYVGGWDTLEKYGRGEGKNCCTQTILLRLILQHFALYDWYHFLCLPTIFPYNSFPLCEGTTRLYNLKNPSLLILLLFYHLSVSSFSTTSSSSCSRLVGRAIWCSVGSQRARARERERRARGSEEDRRKWNLCFQSHGWFPRSSLEIIGECGSQKTASLTNQKCSWGHTSAAIIPIVTASQGRGSTYQ